MKYKLPVKGHVLYLDRTSLQLARVRLGPLHESFFTLAPTLLCGLPQIFETF